MLDSALQGGEVLRYEGDYRDDKRHGRVEELTAKADWDGTTKVTYRGSLDANEHMSGMGVLEAGNVKYTGEFQVNQFNG